MPCIDPTLVARQAPRPVRTGARALRAASVVLLMTLGACSLLPPAKEGARPPAGSEGRPTPTAPTAPTAPAGPHGAVKLPAPRTPQSWADARRQAAERLVAANPDMTYMGKPPILLLAIPVMTIDLNADGSIRQITVMRHPSQARDTVQLATQAIQRAAPFGDVSRLPKPWRFNETFLFKEDRKFKPMTLDQP